MRIVWALATACAGLPASRLAHPVCQGVAEHCGLWGSLPESRIDPTFPGLTVASPYWSSTELAGNPSNAWIVVFDFGHVLNSPKTFAQWGRAVRGGR